MSGSEKVVAVTGSSGYIASWLVKQLLERGYTVKASVRNLDDRRKTEHLLSLDGAKERLHLFQADLLKEGSFDALVHGCHGVFHTASPVSFTVTNPQEELLDPAVKGTLNVLRSCAKSLQSIKRVIVTSSMAAVAYNEHVKPGVTVDETWFSDSTYCQDLKLWYVLSKTLAEEGAWKFAKEHGLDLVVINPGLVIGPLLQPNVSFSPSVILKLLNGGGESLIPNSNMQWVDVRDVSEAHILAFEMPCANGRYCMVERSVRYFEVVNILRHLFPTLQLSNKSVQTNNNSAGNSILKLVDWHGHKEILKAFRKDEQSRAEKVVAVTGASGFIASWLVKLLLDRGYTVKASVRALNKKTENLRCLDGAGERLHLFQADLLEEGSFDAVFYGCEGIFHTASPVLLSASNPEVELLEPAVKGTLNVLRSCARISSIKRVIITSSTAAVAFNQNIKTGVVVDENWFSEPSFCEELKNWYALSKTLAEDSAWKFAKQHGIDLITMNPGLVIGPLLQPFVSLSVEIILDLVNGSETFNSANLRWVDVRDVALAHILALEIPSASGRYCLVERSAHTSEAVNILRGLFPGLQLPDKCVEKNLVPQTYNYTVSNEKAKGLGIQFIPLEVSLKDAVESLREKGFISF